MPPPHSVRRAGKDRASSDATRDGPHEQHGVQGAEATTVHGLHCQTNGTYFFSGPGQGSQEETHK